MKVRIPYVNYSFDAAIKAANSNDEKFFTELSRVGIDPKEFSELASVHVNYPYNAVIDIAIKARSSYRKILLSELLPSKVPHFGLACGAIRFKDGIRLYQTHDQAAWSTRLRKETGYTLSFSPDQFTKCRYDPIHHCMVIGDIHDTVSCIKLIMRDFETFKYVIHKVIHE